VSEAERPFVQRVVPPPVISARPGGERRADQPGVARDVGVVIVAAGKGTRVGGEELKQFRWIAGRPMLLHSVQTFMARPDVAMVVVVLPKSHAADPPPWLFQCDIDRLLVSVGGRAASWTSTVHTSSGMSSSPFATLSARSCRTTSSTAS
jgi:CTP:molybdopterin cytidylyltransferase MocA